MTDEVLASNPMAQRNREITQQTPAPGRCLITSSGGPGKDPSGSEKREIMHATGTENIADAFALDVRVVTDISPDVPTPCQTDDGCANTCASACTSNA